MAKGESLTSRVGGTQGLVLASETERTENCRTVYTAQTVKRDERERWESFRQDFLCTCVFTRVAALSRSCRTTFG